MPGPDCEPGNRASFGACMDILGHHYFTVPRAYRPNDFGITDYSRFKQRSVAAERDLCSMSDICRRALVNDLRGRGLLPEKVSG